MNDLTTVSFTAPVKQERMPVTLRYRTVFAPETATRQGPKGEQIQSETWAIRVTGYTTLIPPGDRRHIREEIEQASAPPTAAQAIELASKLVNSYPGKEVTDPKTYCTAIASVFQTVPRDICAAAVDQITRNLKWFPTRADVHEACQRMMHQRAHALRVVDAHEREARRRQEKYAAEAEAKREKTPEEKQAAADLAARVLKNMEAASAEMQAVPETSPEAEQRLAEFHRKDGEQGASQLARVLSQSGYFERAGLPDPTIEDEREAG